MALGLEISPMWIWVRAESRLDVRVCACAIGWALGAPVKWGWVACDEKQNEEGHKLSYNAYWKTGTGKIKV